MDMSPTWRIFKGTRQPHDDLGRLPPPPPWRPYRSTVGDERALPLDVDDHKLPPAALQRGKSFHATEHVIDMVNAALYLRRPLLVTGQPGSGKSSLIDAVAYELRMGAPLRWSVTSRSTLRDALYQYDAIGRLQQQEAGPADKIGDFITLGPLGTALLPTSRPRALLIDEIDKSDIDLPNDLLNVFEEGEFEIPELRRLGTEVESEVFTSDPNQSRVKLRGGTISCHEFPLMILTSNGEREFPAPFLRRCLRLRMPNPTGSLPEDDNKEWKRLDAIIDLHFATDERKAAEEIIANFKVLAGKREVATDQLLNAIYFVMSSQVEPGKQRDDVIAELTRELAISGS
ncbi:AAA family ATPase [Burkholderia stagnalis]|uniref:AAA family ATPase n=1 Tax=Burkholderia stagnalis TaxID=1503054 RepID=UPI00325B185E